MIIVADDADDDALTYVATGLPDGISLTASNTLEGTPTTVGSYPVTVTVTDGNGGTASTTFTWQVVEVSQSLVLVNPGPQTNTEGDRVRLQLDWTSTAIGRRRDIRPTFSAVGLPPGLRIHHHQGEIRGHVERDGEGTYLVTVTLQVQDEVVTQTFTWTIVPKNHAPRIKHLDDHTSKVGDSIDIQLKGSDGTVTPCSSARQTCRRA